MKSKWKKRDRKNNKEVMMKYEDKELERRRAKGNLKRMTLENK